MGKRDDVLNTISDRVLLSLSQIGWLHNYDAMLKGQKQSLQALMKRERLRNNVSCVLCSDFPGYGNSKEYAYTDYNRRVPKRMGGHILSINQAITCLEMAKHITGFPWEIIEIAPEYKISYEHGRFVSNTSETLGDSTVLIPDVRVRFRTGQNEQAIWFIECDNGTEPLISLRPGYSYEHWKTAEDDGRHVLEASSLCRKLILYRDYINDRIWEKYENDGGVIAVQNLYIFQSELRRERFREAVIQLAGREQKFVWILNRNALKTPIDFWLVKLWKKAVNEPKLFSIFDNGMNELDRLNI